MIKIKLKQTNYFTHWPCTICGGETNRDAVLCEGENESIFVRVCPECLSEPDSVDEKIEQRAIESEAYAQKLRELKGNLALPSFEDWESANTAVNDELMAELDGGEPANDSGDLYYQASLSENPVLLSAAHDDFALIDLPASEAINAFRGMSGSACMRCCDRSLLDAYAFRRRIPVPGESVINRGDWYTFGKSMDWDQLVDLFAQQANNRNGGVQ